MLAAEIDSLKGGELCNSLKKMDEKEVQKLNEEETRYKTAIETIHNNNSITRNIGWTMTAIGVGLFSAALFSSGEAKYNGIFLGTTTSGFGLVMGGGITIATAGDLEKKESQKLEHEILDNRILRLMSKNETISFALQNCQDEEEKTQLTECKNYFELKRVELLSNKTNNVNLNVRRV
jgi:hypothetical protein